MKSENTDGVCVDIVAYQRTIGDRDYDFYFSLLPLVPSILFEIVVRCTERETDVPIAQSLVPPYVFHTSTRLSSRISNVRHLRVRFRNRAHFSIGHRR